MEGEGNPSATTREVLTPVSRMMIDPAEYSLRLHSAGSIIIPETGVHSALLVTGRAGAIRSKGGSEVSTVSRMTIDPAFEAAPRHLISFSPHPRAPWCVGFGVLGLGFRVSGFRVQGLGFRV